VAEYVFHQTCVKSFLFFSYWPALRPSFPHNAPLFHQEMWPLAIRCARLVVLTSPPIDACPLLPLLVISSCRIRWDARLPLSIVLTTSPLSCVSPKQRLVPTSPPSATARSEWTAPGTAPCHRAGVLRFPTPRSVATESRLPIAHSTRAFGTCICPNASTRSQKPLSTQRARVGHSTVMRNQHASITGVHGMRPATYVA
jgi:hypothetical protein